MIIDCHPFNASVNIVLEKRLSKKDSLFFYATLYIGLIDLCDGKAYKMDDFNDRFYRLSSPLTLGSELGFTGFLGLQKTSSL